MKKQYMIKWVLISLIVLVMVVGTPASILAKNVIVLDFVSFVSVKMFEFSGWKKVFIDEVNARTKGELKIKVRGGPEVVGQFDQAMALKSGFVHMMYAPTAFYTSLVPGLDSWRLSESTAGEERESGAFELISKMCEKAGFKYLGRALTSNPGKFLLFTNKKAETPSDFKGMKIGASPSFHGYTKGLGAVNVSLHISEYYSAMERGVVDAFITSMGVFVGTGAHEVTKYALDEPFYTTTNALLVNLKTWNSIPKHLQKIIAEIAIEQEKTWLTINDAEIARLKKKAIKAGVEFYKLSPSIEKWNYNAAYEVAWEEDEKRFPPDIVRKMRSVLKKN